MPTVATESVLLTAAVDAHEGRYLATFDIPEAHLCTETDKYVVNLLGGALSHLMEKVVPSIY